jgi:hypothetical protein
MSVPTDPYFYTRGWSQPLYIPILQQDKDPNDITALNLKGIPRLHTGESKNPKSKIEASFF